MLVHSAIAHLPSSAHLSNKPPVPCSHKAEDVLSKAFMLQWVLAISCSTLNSPYFYHFRLLSLLPVVKRGAQDKLPLLNLQELSLSCSLCSTESVPVLFLIASMMASGAHKRSSAARCNPLSEAGILERVLSYVPGQWLFLAAVSSLWRDMYSQLAAMKMQTRSCSNVGENKTVDVTCAPHTTLYSTVFASSSRVKYAHASGVDCSTPRYQFAAGRHATVASLITASEVGMQYSVATMRGVADSSTLPVMQFLHAQGCPWDEAVPSIAAGKSDLEMRWLCEHGCPWQECCLLNIAVSSGSIELTAWVKQQPEVVCDQDTMNTAARKGFTAICEYLHAEQCPWSALTCFCAAVHGHVDTLRWLHENGCPWNAAHTCEAGAAGGSMEVIEYVL
jgi:hypothetical protein